MAVQTAFLASKHQDLLTSLAFNALSPHLLATSSLDAHVRIHSRAAASAATPAPDANGDVADAGGAASAPPGAWEEVASFRAHEGPVLRVRWAEGEWGDLLASCGSDGSVRVWDQAPASATPLYAANGDEAPAPPPRSSGARRWQQRACLVDARGSVRDVAFAPADFGLHLAAISADGTLRLYDCPDPSETAAAAPLAGVGAAVSAAAGLASWNLLEAVEVDKLPLTATSSAGGTAGSSAFTAFGSSNISLGGLGSLGSGGAAGSLTSVAATSSSSGSSGAPRVGGLLEADGGWALSWCKESWYGECLACASGTSPAVRIIRFSPPSSWVQPLVLQPPSAARSAPVASLDWAPGGGRSYQLVAAGYRDGAVRIWKVWPPTTGAAGVAVLGDQWRGELVADLTEHVGGAGGVGRVEWNLTGTVLSTAGDDGKVRLWKASYAGEWCAPCSTSSLDIALETGTDRRAVATISCDQDAPEADGMDGAR